MTADTRGQILLVVGPQGAGKTYLANQFVEHSADYVIAPGIVTRPARSAHDNDIEVTRDEFNSMRAAGLLCLEATVGEHNYAYLQNGIEAQLSAGKRVLVLLLYPEDVLAAKRLWPAARTEYLRPGDWDLIARRLALSRGYGVEEVTRLIDDGKRLVHVLDGLEWAHRIDIVDGTEQAHELLKWIATRGW
jgi:ribose 1,5-bisphosphokinase PhnN